MNYEAAIKYILDTTDGDAKIYDLQLLTHIITNGSDMAKEIANGVIDQRWDLDDAVCSNRCSFIWAMAEGDNWSDCGYSKHQVIAFAKALEVAINSIEVEVVIENLDNWTGESATVMANPIKRTFSFYDYDWTLTPLIQSGETDPLFQISSTKLVGSNWNEPLETLIFQEEYPSFKEQITRAVKYIAYYV